jgi:predicted sugar kinase
VLITPRQSIGVSGDGEQAAFERLPPVPEDLTAQLRTEAEDELLPAATRGDFAAFSRSLFRFGQLAGRCFQSQQAGIYATPQTVELVEAIRRCGVEGVGQSSWGPTLFALARDERGGLSLAEDLNRESPRDLEITIARPLNIPAMVGVTEA